MKKTFLASAVGVALAGSMMISGAQASEAPSFSYFSASYAQLGVDSSDSIDGFALDLSVAMTESGFFRANHESYSEGALKLDLTRVGIGFKSVLSEATAAYAGGGLAFGKFKAGWFNESDEGWHVFGGVAARVHRAVELFGELSHYDVFDSGETDVTLGARFYVSDRASFGASYIFADGDERMKLGITIHW